MMRLIFWNYYYERSKIQSEYADLDKYKDNYENIWYCKKDTNINHNPYGPAFIYSDGETSYYIEDRCHRLDGPAKVYNNGKGEYWINGRHIGNTKEEFYNKIKNLKIFKVINKQDKVNILNIKNSLSNGLDNDGVNILKLLLWPK